MLNTNKPFPCSWLQGQWLDNLGIGDANALVGRPDSIAVRMPDNCVTSYLLDQTGPVATTSANPTGEADTTHHLQVLAKLGLENVSCLVTSHSLTPSLPLSLKRGVVLGQLVG